MNRYISEFIGTFALVFVGTGAIVINQETGGSITHVGIAISFGLIVMAMIYAVGDISGAHLNPAVTIAFWFAKKFDLKDVFPYITAQLLGGFLASGTLLFLFPANEFLGATIPSGSESQSGILEFILTFLLMFVIIQVSTGSKETGTMAGLTIGGVVLLEAMFAGPITGASMNPARSIAPAFVSGHTEHLWIYIVAPILGAIAAIYTCKLIREDECCEGEC
jgi:aquaporin NIP